VNCESVHGHLAESAMIWLTVIVTALLFIYLLTALLRPEWF
jgi:K+-transporting ATPase KdpF subunit